MSEPKIIEMDEAKYERLLALENNKFQRLIPEWLAKIIMGVMICSVIIACFLFYNAQYRDCTNDPFVYGAVELEELTGEKIMGKITFLSIHEGAPTIYFDSVNTTVVNPTGMVWDIDPSVRKFLEEEYNIINATLFDT